MFFSTLSIFAVAAAGANMAPTQGTHHVIRIQGDRAICTGATPTEIREIEEQRLARKRYWHLREQALVDTYRERDISALYSDDFPEEAKDAFQAAMNIWDSYLLIDVPITIEAIWEENEDEDEEGSKTLAKQSGTVWCTSWACRDGTLANQRAGRDLDSSEPEFEITVSSSANWYFSLDGNPPADQFDFISVIVHEIGHGLGIGSGLHLPTEEPDDDEEPTAELWTSEDDVPRLFDRFVWSIKHNWVDDLESPSVELYELATGHKLFWSWQTNTRECRTGHN